MLEISAGHTLSSHESWHETVGVVSVFFVFNNLQIVFGVDLELGVLKFVVVFLIFEFGRFVVSP